MNDNLKTLKHICKNMNAKFISSKANEIVLSTDNYITKKRKRNN